MDGLARQIQGVDQSRRHDHGGSMLVVVENRDAMSV